MGCFLLWDLFFGFFFLSFPPPPPPVWKEGGLARTSLDGAVERRGVRGWEGGLVVGGCRGCCSCIGVSPMDENSPLSPKANAFSIASLISVAAAAEQAGKGALEERRGGRSAPARPGCRPQKMHFSTVTRDMEGERRARPLRAAGTGPPRATASRRVFTRPGPAAGPEGAHGARPGRGAGRRGLCRAPPPAGPGPRSPPWENKALPVPRWRLPTAPPLGPASPRRCWSILRQRRPCPGQRRAGARLPLALQSLSGSGTAAEITQDTPRTSRSLSASEGIRGSRPFPGAACHAPQGPLGPAAEGCAAGAVPALLGADPELCSGPRLFPLFRPGMERRGDCQTRFAFPCQLRPRGPRARDITCSTVATRK